jgi:thioredoxin reductase (NADPH)
MAVRDLLIVGAGPTGLSAAIAAGQRGLDYHVIEQGVLVNSIYHFPPQMVFFTTPELLEIGGLPFVSPYEKPTRAEALRYYRKVVDTFDLQITFGETAVAIERDAAGRPGPLFTVKTRPSRQIDPSAYGGTPGSREPHVHYARNVLLATGYYGHPSLLGVPGEELPHVHHYYGDPHPYYRQRVVIVGGGNSAAEAALDLYRAGAHVTLVHRRAELKSTIKYWVRPDIENRIKEGSIAAWFNTCVREIRPASVIVRAGRAGEAGEAGEAGGSARGPREDRESSSAGARASGGGAPRAVENDGESELPADAVFLLTGYHADWELLSRAGISLNSAGVPFYDPDTMETNIPGLFVAGGAITGNDTAPIFIENGRFHGEKIVTAIMARRKPEPS